MEVSAQLSALEATLVLVVCYPHFRKSVLGWFISCAGYNIQGRQYGMAVDDITSMQIVLATGEIVTASSTVNYDLWWGARGGGTYGIITSITINTQVFPRSATVNIQFPNASTRYEVTRKYIDWAPRQVVEFGSQINMYR
jgi:FAD/FMN-containing dehydrogenase